jgi:hypothetical protein
MEISPSIKLTDVVHLRLTHAKIVVIPATLVKLVPCELCWAFAIALISFVIVS